ncbi:MAG: hypothetical protein ACI9ON_000871 [Limisphaerales bacterium]|jgi:hypothetical protein
MYTLFAKFWRLLVGSLMCLLMTLPASADEFWAGLASFRAQTNAQRFAQLVSSQIDSPVTIVKTETGAGTFFRVLGGPYNSEQSARSAIVTAKNQGYESAWLVRGEFNESVNRHVNRPHTDNSQADISQKNQSRTPNASEAPVDQLGAKETLNEPAIAHSNSSGSTAESALAINVGLGEQVHLTTVARKAITVDGHVNEAEWSTAAPITDFVTLEPATMVPGKYPTEVRFLYNEEGLYFSAVMRQPVETLVKRLTGRDVRDNRDRIGITIDTSGEGLYGFWFGIMLGDSLMDGTLLPERIFSSDWDGPWHARSQTLEDGWSAEIFVPWGTVSMPAVEDERHMGMYVSRNVAHLNENWGWPALAPTGAKFMSDMQPLVMRDVEPRQQYSIYPFVSTAFDWVDDDPKYRAGADFFWRPSSNFQLNATVNPDFGIVESDEVVINLTATETFFPEKRLFFLEGQEVFSASPRADTRSSSVGNQGSPYTMVNTRRIGGKPLTPTLGPGVSIDQRETNQPTDLIGAVKTTGQIGSVRYGVLGAFEEEVKFDVVSGNGPENLHQAGNDYGIARILYQDSSGGSYRGLGFLSTAVLNEERGDALVQGVDWHYLSAEGRIKIDGQVMSSDLDRIDDRGYGGFLDFEFTYAPGVKHRLGLEYFDENIDINDLGFLERNDEYRVRSALTLTHSDLSWAKQNQLDIRGFVQKSVTENLFTRGGIFASNRTDMKNLSALAIRVGYLPSYYDDLNSFGNGSFRIEDRVDLNVAWSTDTAKQLSFTVGAGYAEDELGDAGYKGEAALAWRPTYQFGVELGVKYKDQKGWLLHQGDGLFATFEAKQWLPNLAVEYFISARQQVRLSLQWVGIKAQERDFFSVPGQPGDLIPTAKPSGVNDPATYDFAVSQYAFQLRYRWELAPLSDIFLVYTRQANLRSALGEAGFNDLFDNAWEDPLADVFIMKLRYRFGS